MKSEAVQFHDAEPGTASLLAEVLAGLARKPKSIPPKFFYDERGSKLFDQICEQPEYYPTRTETDILQTHASDMAEWVGPGAMLVELGSGASRKVRLLLESLRPAAYLGMDISRDFLLESTGRLAADYPWLEVHAACVDFSAQLDLPGSATHYRKVAFFPGSSIGNFEPDAAQRFLEQIRAVVGSDGGLLIGVDLKKDPAMLNAAYNDARGITAEFNLNLLRRIRDELDSDVVVERFRHHAFYNESHGRVEMHLVSDRAQHVRVAGQRFPFAAGESIHTESSYKYSIEEFQRLAERAGFASRRVWTDPRRLFSVQYLVRD